MIPFSDLHIRAANEQDIPVIVKLLNGAYRGENSKKGWTTEAHLIDGNVRADEASVKDVIVQPGSLIVIYFDDNGNALGCVNLQKHGDKIYLGMLAVDPEKQSSGIGKKILKAAEEYALATNCRSIYMTVISLREELINWYMRHGYVDTGERKSFEDDGTAGRHLQKLQFMVMEKYL